MARNADRPEWVKWTPSEMYDKGVQDAALYARAGKLDGMLEYAPAPKPKQRNAFYGGMIAQAYGINLRPSGRF